jgi:hypothetical protein
METKTRVRETENDDYTLKATTYLVVLSKRVAIGQTSDVTAGNEEQCHNDDVARENNTMEDRGMMFVWLRNRHDCESFIFPRGAFGVLISRSLEAQVGCRVHVST